MRRLPIAVLGLALVAAGCSGSDSAETTQAPTTALAAFGNVDVSIASFAFGPDEITIPVGTTVTWTNDEDGIPHTSTSDDGVWNSATLDPGESFSFTFTEPGTYAYSCQFHPSMTATVIVRDDLPQRSP